jgi:hypothetical protein
MLHKFKFGASIQSFQARICPSLCLLSKRKPPRSGGPSAQRTLQLEDERSRRRYEIGSGYYRAGLLVPKTATQLSSSFDLQLRDPQFFARARYATG